MAKPHSLNYKNIERLRNLYERHCELLDLKFREDILVVLKYGNLKVAWMFLI